MKENWRNLSPHSNNSISRN